MIDLFRAFGISLPDQASTYAPSVDNALGYLHIGMVLIFVLWSLFFTVALIKFRRAKNPAADPNVNKWGIRSFLPDVAILSFEIWLIFVFGLPIWAQIKEKFPSQEEALVVNMTAEQFAWSFQYAGPDGLFGRRDPSLMSPTNPMGIDRQDPPAKDDIVTLNQLFVPVNKPVIVNMTSKDVIHNFFVPEFRVKQDVVPGMNIPLWFEATKTGDFVLGCSQLCGLGHFRMKGQVLVLSQEEFQAKLNEIKAEELAS